MIRWMAASLALASMAMTARADLVAITGATIHTLGPLGSIEAGTVLIENGVLVGIGESIAIPGEAERIDATGKIVTPGMFDAYSYLGAVEIGLVAGTVDALQQGERFSASFDITPVINPRSTLIPVNRIEGVTHAMVAPAPADELASLFSGLGTVINLGGATDFVVAPRAAMFAQMGETGAVLSGGSRAAALLSLREALGDARDYAAHRSAYQERRRRDYSLGHRDLEALQPVLAGDIPLVITAHRASDIGQVVTLAEQERLSVVVAGGAEAWMLADRLAELDIPVILDPTANLPVSFEALNATLQNAARLQRAGVKVAFTSGDSHNSRNIRQLAGNAVAHGMAWEQALRAVTVHPAEIYGSPAGGALEVGSKADLVVWSGDPLEVTTAAEQVFIAGRAIPMRSRQTLLRDRYRELDPDLPHAYQKP